MEAVLKTKDWFGYVGFYDIVELVPQANRTYDYESKVIIKEAIQVVGQELESGELWCRWYTLPLHTILKKDCIEDRGETKNNRRLNTLEAEEM